MSAKIHAREFGKLAPYLRYKGCQPRERLVAVTREPRLFNQNIGGRQIERLCTAAEACPVLVSESRFQPDEGPVNGGGNYDPRPRGSQNSAICGNLRESLRTAIAVTIARCGQSAGKADLARDRNPQRLHAEPRESRDDDTVRPSRRREEVARNRGPPPRNRRSRK